MESDRAAVLRNRMQRKLEMEIGPGLPPQQAAPGIAARVVVQGTVDNASKTLQDETLMYNSAWLEDPAEESTLRTSQT